MVPEKNQKNNPMFCPFCKDPESASVIPIDVVLNLSICIKCKQLWRDGILVKIIPMTREYNPSRRKL